MMLRILRVALIDKHHARGLLVDTKQRCVWDIEDVADIALSLKPTTKLPHQQLALESASTADQWFNGVGNVWYPLFVDWVRGIALSFIRCVACGWRVPMRFP